MIKDFYKKYHHESNKIPFIKNVVKYFDELNNKK